MADQQSGEPPTKRQKLDSFLHSDNSVTDEYATILANELPDVHIDQWTGDQTGSSTGCSTNAGSSNVNGIIDSSAGGGNQTINASDRSQQLSHVLQKAPTQGLSSIGGQGPYSIAQQSHISSQNSMIMHGSNNVKVSSMLASQAMGMNKVGVQTSMSSNSDMIMSQNNNMGPNLSGQSSLSSAVSPNANINISMANSNLNITLSNSNMNISSNPPMSGGNMGGNMNVVAGMNSMNTINKTQGIMTSMNVNPSMVGQQINDITNGPIGGMNRTIGVSSLRVQSPQTINQGMAPRHQGMTMAQMGARIPMNAGNVTQQLQNYQFTNIQSNIDNSGVQPNQRTVSLGMPPRYPSQDISMMTMVRGPQPSAGTQNIVSCPSGVPGNHQTITAVGQQVVPNSNQTCMPQGSNVQPRPGPGANAIGHLNQQQRSNSADPEKRKLIQQQLVLLLHAHKCQRRESQATGETKQCSLPHCATMKNVLNHMTTCQEGKACQVSHCASSRQIISHWKNCNKGDCPVCEPLKQAEQKKHPTSNAAIVNNQVLTVAQPGHSPNVAPIPHIGPQVTLQQDIRSGMPISKAPNAVGQLAGLNQSPVIGPPNHVGSPTNQVMRPQVGGNIQINALIRPPPNIGQVRSSIDKLPDGSLPPGGIAIPQISPQRMNMSQQPPSYKLPMTSNQMTSNLAESLLSMPTPVLPVGVGPVTAKPAEGTKDWHTGTTTELRNHLVQKLVQTILPGPDPYTLHDQKMQSLVMYARKVEGDMFAMANSRAEYYHLLAEKIYKIQKELEEKRLMRRPPGVRDGQPLSSTNEQQSHAGPPTPMPLSQGATGMPGTHQILMSQQLPVGTRVVRTHTPPNHTFPAVALTRPSLVRPQLPNPGNKINLQNVQGCQKLMQNQSDHVGQASAAGKLSSTCSLGSSSPQMGILMTTSNSNMNIQIGCSPGSAKPINSIAQSLSMIRPQAPPPPYSASQDKNISASGFMAASIPGQMNMQTTVSSDLISPGYRTEHSFDLNQSSVSSAPNSQNETLMTTASGQDSAGSSTTTPMNVDVKNDKAMLMTVKQEGADYPEIKMEPKEPDEDYSDKKIEISSDKMAEVKSEMDEPMSSASKADKPMMGGKKIKTEITSPPSSGKTMPMMMTNIKPVEPKTEEMEVSTSNTVCTAPSVPPSTIVKKERQPLFKSEELRQHLVPSFDKMFRQDPESIPFRQPVDPQALSIPDYFDIIKKPMDMSSIKRRLDTGYYTDPWDYVDDVWLMFDNAWIYNRKTSRVYKYCTKLAEVFEQEIDSVMQQLGYCCGRKYTFNPQVLCCYGKQLCTIPRDAKYFSYQGRYSYCFKCFNDIQGDTINLGDDPSQPGMSIKKAQFQELKNDQLDLEPLVECQDCGRKQHQICVVYTDAIWQQGFSCEGCLKVKSVKRKENRYTSKRLPVTRLSSYLETRVNNFLKKKEARSGEVYVRVVSATDKIVEVKSGMKSRFVNTGQLPGEFPYRAKALFAFEEIDGVDVCFFGMHVQEYGSECPAPNTRRVYLAYLDSVHFFRPRDLRTNVYYEMLLGYLDYVKQLGYTMAHIWACPPSEGDDYVFHCHPPDQKIPKPKRLQDWYKRMLDKGIVERIVLDYKDIHKQAYEDNLKSPAQLPYFEGDFWPNVMEESIKELDQEEEEKRKQEEAEAAQVVDEEEETIQDDKKKGQKKHKQKIKSKSQTKNKSKVKSNSSGCTDLAAKIFATMDKHKDVFFVIRLHSAQSAVSLPPIQDPDPIIVCDLMDGRDAFLTLASERHLEFSSLRRAKYSTMVMLYELHNQNQDKFVYTCNKCKNQVETRFHCQECDDFDLCISCYHKEGHPHKMVRLGLGLEDGTSSSESKILNPQEARRKSIQRCIQSVVHATQCRDANCRLNSCSKMKRVLQHAKTCRKKNDGGCSVCKQLIALCYFHARNCKETRCSIPYCANIKQKLKQQEMQQRFQQNQLMQRRMQQMNQRMMSSSQMVNSTATVTQPTQSPVHVAEPGMKPKQQPTSKALEAVKAVQRHAMQQAVTTTSVSYGKGNPSNMPMVAQQQQPQQQLVSPHMVNQQGRPMMQGNTMVAVNAMGPPPSQVASMGKPNMAMQHGQQQVVQNRTLPGMDLWNTRYPNAVGGMQGQQGQGTSMRPMMVNQNNPQQGQVAPGGQPMMGPPNQPNQQGQQRNTTQLLHHLVQTLQNTSGPHQQQEILKILKQNPTLMAAFIRQKALQEGQRQGQQQQGGMCQTGMTQGNMQQIGQGLQGNMVNMQQHGNMVNQMNSNQPMQQQQQQQSTVVLPNQNMPSHQPWYQKQQIQIRQQPQQQGFQQPQTPMYTQQRRQVNFQQINFQGSDGQYQQGFSQQQQQQQQQQQLLMQQQQIKSVPPSMSPQPGMMSGVPMGNTQQLMQSVTSPPPNNLAQTVRSPQPNPSPRSHQPMPSPRPVPSPHHPAPVPSPRPVHSPHPSGQPGSIQVINPTSESMMLSQVPVGHHIQTLPSLQVNSQQMNMPPANENEMSSLTPQDQLSQIVEHL